MLRHYWELITIIVLVRKAGSTVVIWCSKNKVENRPAFGGEGGKPADVGRATVHCPRHTFTAVERLEGDRKGKLGRYRAGVAAAALVQASG